MIEQNVEQKKNEVDKMKKKTKLLYIQSISRLLIVCNFHAISAKSSDENSFKFQNFEFQI